MLVEKKWAPACAGGGGLPSPPQACVKCELGDRSRVMQVTYIDTRAENSVRYIYQHGLVFLVHG